MLPCVSTYQYYNIIKGFKERTGGAVVKHLPTVQASLVAISAKRCAGMFRTFSSS